MTKPPTPRCLIGFDYTPPKGGKSLRFEPGDLVSGVPTKTVRALAEAVPPVVELAPPAADAAKDAA